MRSFLYDIRLAARALRARPLFLTATVLTLALGIGASTATFGVIQSTLLRPLPFPAAERLAVVQGVAGPERDVRGGSPIEIRDWDRMTEALGPLAAYNETTLNLTGDGQPERLEAEIVTSPYFGVVGIAPALGRDFDAADDQAGAAGVAIIGDRFWRTRYGADPDAIGASILLDGVGFTIVGVMPPGFTGLSFDTEIWTTMGPFFSPAGLEDRGSRWLGAVGRLSDGATEEQAQAELTAAARRLEETYPGTNTERGASLVPLRDIYVAGASRELLLMVLAGVGLLLLIACANVANLQLVRASQRTPEIALRYALGAGRGRVARHVMAESVVLALAGGAAGVALAWAGLQALFPLIPPGALPPYASPAIDAPVLAFAALLTIAAGALFGLAPAMRVPADAGATALRTARGVTGQRGRRGRPGPQQVIVAAQVAVALVLLLCAGLAIRSFARQLAIDPGFRADGVLAAAVSLTGDGYDSAARTVFVQRLLEEVSGLPGVERAAVTFDAPLRGGYSASILRREGFPEDDIRYYRHPVSPGFFETLEIPILAGRGFTAADHADAPGVAVVTRAFAEKLYPGEGAVGKRINVLGDTATIVGVVGNVRQRSLTTSLMDPGEDPDVYFSFAQVTPRTFDILIRARDPVSLTPALRERVAELDAAIPVFAIGTLSDALAQQTALARLVTFLLGTFGALALVLAAIGLYGVLAFVVRGRRREIALRVAIGAAPREILRMVMRQGLVLVGVGLVLGGAAAWLAGRALAATLYGVSASDPLVLAVTASVLLTVAAGATWIPARQATRVDPGRVLGE